MQVIGAIQPHACLSTLYQMVLNLRRPSSLHTAVAGRVLLLYVVWTSSSFQDGSHYSLSGGRETLQRPVDHTSDIATSIPIAPADPKTLRRLIQTLEKLDAARILDYDDALELNERTCDGREIQSNQDQINGESSFWRSLSSRELLQKRSNLIFGLRDAFDLPSSLSGRASPNGSYPIYGEGKGLVYTGGNAVSIENATTVELC